MSDSARDRLRKILGYGGKTKNTLSAPVRPSPAAAPTPPAPARNPIAQPAPLTSRNESSNVAPKREPADPTPPATPRTSSLASLAARPAFLGTHTQPDHPKPPIPGSDLRGFLQELRTKMAQLAEDFAQGKLNRTQFQEIYAHYQKQRQSVEAAMVRMPDSDEWRNNLGVGKTGLLRERHAAKILSYAIYDNLNSLPLASVGTFRIDTSLLVPMLSSFRSAATEMFGAGLRSTEIEGGHWLCFVPGHYSTLIVLFSVEPARVQLTLVEDLHRDFEVANRVTLAKGYGHEGADLFTRIWALVSNQLDGTSD